MVSYNILDAQHSGDRVILLVGPQSYDTYLSVTNLQVTCSAKPNSVAMFASYGATPTVHDVCQSFLSFDLATIY